jgi:SAM-dependent methyltransferase
MNENPAASDWTAARDEKWRAQIAGMEAMIEPVNGPLIRALHLDAPCRIADVGCGGGQTTLEILQGAPTGSVVHGYDISAALIELARVRISSEQRAIAFKVADMATATAAEPYDRLASRFAVMFFDDPSAAFANLFRWLAPGGRFAFAVWGPLAENPWMTTVRNVVAEIIDLSPPEPDAPGPFRYSDADKLIVLLSRAGFAELNVRDWRGMLEIGGGLRAEAAASFALASYSSFGELLAEAGAQAFNNVLQLLTERFVRHQYEGAIRMDACVHIFTGTRLA